MKNMSFSHTTEQIRSRSKTVTRRLGWGHLRPNDLVRAVLKAQGLKRGEKVEPLATLRIKSVVAQPLRLLFDHPHIGKAEMINEGFPDMDPRAFVAWFCSANGCKSSQIVNRVEFEYVDEAEAI